MTLSSSEALALSSLPAGMTPEQTTSVLELFVAGNLELEEGARILRAWSGRGETAAELAAAVRFFKSRALKVPVTVPCFDLCGTGGSGLERYNISTTVAFVVAASGIPVAKHGNRGSQRPNGSVDLLEALEVPFELSPEQEAQLQHESGLCFIFARTHHPAIGQVVPYRKAALGRTIFNLAGPLANPAKIQHQIIGTVNETTAKIVAGALFELGSQGALVVFGEPGIDEISVTGKTGTLHVTPAGITEGTFTTPTHPGLDYSLLPHGDATENKVTFLNLLSGIERGPLLDMVCQNAGAAIDLWAGRVPAYNGTGFELARTLIAGGRAMETFEKHRQLAQRLVSKS